MGKLLQISSKVALAAVLPIVALSAFASESLPYTCDFTTSEKLSTWQTLDVDGDGLTWVIGKPDYGSDMAKSQAAYSTFGNTDNRLISPSLTLPAGKNMSLKFKYYTAYYQSEILDIFLSTSPLTDSTEEGILIQSLTLNSYYGKEQMVLIPALETAGDYYINIIHRASAENNFGFVFFLTDLSIDEVKDGNLAGTVSTQNGPLAGASVAISGAVAKNCITNAEGQYHFGDIPSGVYTVEFSAFGYNTTTKTFDVVAEQTTDGSVTLYEMQKAKVSGKVTDAEGTPVKGAEICLQGYTFYRTFTDAAGNYEFPGVYLYDYYASSPYTLTVQRNNFVASDPKRITMYYDYNAGTTILQYDILKAHSVEVFEGENGNIVEWERPVTTTWLKHDNGNPSSPLGYDSGRYDNILGTIYREPMTVSDFEWYTFNNRGENDKVTIYIISLDENGEPTGNILYTAQDIDNVPDEWNRYHLPSEVVCPNGFMLAMSGIGNICLAKDDSETVEPKTQLYSNTYALPETYTYFEDVNYKGALCLRAAGEKIQPEIPLKLKYNLFRIESKDKDDKSKWVMLLPETTETSYEDASFATLPRGSYQYAVVAIYDIGGQESEATFSEICDHLQTTTLNLYVTANSDQADTEGAKVSLSSVNSSPMVAYVSNGNVSFSNIRKADEYRLTVTQKGFETYEAVYSLNQEEVYRYEVELKQILAPVANIDVKNEGGDLILTYDFFADINDSFETDDYADFEINPAGDNGWQYYDGDGLYTYGFTVSTFPGAGSRMAAVILDSSKTEPVLNRSVANTGSRALGFFCPKKIIDEGGNEVTFCADDWLISPALDFHRDFTFSFYAMTWESQDNRLENFRVGYSTGGSQPDDFIFLDPETGVSVPLQYTRFSYEIPKEANYVALNSRSNDVFLLCVDDIALQTGCKHSGEAPSGGHFINYEVSVNGSDPVTTNSNEIELSAFELRNGSNTAEVTKVYNSGKSRILSIDFNYTSGVNNILSDDFDISYIEREIIASGLCSAIEVISLDGVCVAKVEDTTRFSTENLAKGIYIIRVTSSTGEIRIRRIIVQ